MKNIYIHIDEEGNKFYYKDKKMTIRHREDGPAIEWVGGGKGWFINDKLHREDGPALEYSDGSKEWWIDDEKFTKEEFIKRTAPTIELSLDEIADKFGVSVDKLKIKK